MVSTDALSLTPLAARDITGCMALSAEAGWNQLPDDWTLFLERGAVFGLMGGEGRPLATGAILPYGNAFAWVSMVLVTAPSRRARIGTRILEACCTELTQRRLVAVLDATPAGEQVYRPLGFEPLFGLTRRQGAGDGRGGIPAGIRLMRESDLPVVADIDAAAFGARRSFLLENFFRRAPHLAFVTEDGEGFALARPGRIATQVGPVVARTRTPRPRCSARHLTPPPDRYSSIFATAGRELRANSNGAVLQNNGRSCAWRCAMTLRSAMRRARSSSRGQSLVERESGCQRWKIPTNVASARRCFRASLSTSRYVADAGTVSFLTESASRRK
jgi:hypothetical protein